MIVSNDLYENKKPRSQWKSRLVFAMYGLFLGAVGAHNFYLGRKNVAWMQVILLGIWLPMLLGLWSKAFGLPQGPFTILAGALAAGEMIWVYLEMFLVKREPDGDLMNDEAYPVRILLTCLVIFVYVVMPGLFYLFISWQNQFVSEDAREAAEMRRARHERIAREEAETPAADVPVSRIPDQAQ